jgi:flagellar assembly factor FliW
MLNFQSFQRDINGSYRVLQNQFGEIIIDETKMITMPMGMIGVPETNHMALSACPIVRFGQCCILQSLDNEKIGFLILPINIDNNPWIEPEELVDALNAINIATSDAAIALVLCKDNEGNINANVRAPIFLDTKHRVGAQFVLPNQQLSTSMRLEI